MSLWPPTEVAEGYQYETVRENYMLSDGTRHMHISYVQPLRHVEGMLMAYLPKEKIVIEADLYDQFPRGRHSNGSESHFLQSRAETGTGCGDYCAYPRSPSSLERFRENYRRTMKLIDQIAAARSRVLVTDRPDLQLTFIWIASEQQTGVTL